MKTQTIEEGYLVDRDVVSYEGLYRGPDRLTFLVRWAIGGPEQLEGRIAAEGQFTFTEGRTELFLKVEDQCEIDEDLVKAVCQVYCVQGAVEVCVVASRYIQDLGTVRVR